MIRKHPKSEKQKLFCHEPAAFQLKLIFEHYHFWLGPFIIEITENKIYGNFTQVIVLIFGKKILKQTGLSLCFNNFCGNELKLLKDI